MVLISHSPVLPVGNVISISVCLERWEQIFVVHCCWVSLHSYLIDALVETELAQWVVMAYKIFYSKFQVSENLYYYKPISKIATVYELDTCLNLVHMIPIKVYINRIFATNPM